MASSSTPPLTAARHSLGIAAGWGAELWRFLRARAVGWGFMVVLAVIAYFSARLALDTQYKAPRKAPAMMQKHAPDFTATGFTVWRSSLDGQTQYQLSADSMVHYRDDLTSVLLKPVIHAKTVPNAALNKPAGAYVHTHITAQNGLLRNDGEVIELTNTVNIVRTVPGAPPSKTTLQSDSFVLLPDSGWMATRSPVKLVQGPHSSMAQRGMLYSHGDADLLLDGPVRTTIAPKPPSD